MVFIFYESVATNGNDCREIRLRDVLRALDAARTDKRIERVVLHLDELQPSGFASLRDVATAIGAANTLIFLPSGTVADNTDAPGLIDALPGPVAGSKALVFGAGGAARAVLWALLAEGAEVTVWNRTPERAERLVADLGGVADTDPDASAFDLLVNSSAAGLGGGDGLAELPVDAGQIGSGQVVVDMVYGDGPGSLLDAATAAGAETVDGLEILVRQGARSLEIWTGLKPSLDVMRRAVRGDA